MDYIVRYFNDFQLITRKYYKIWFLCYYIMTGLVGCLITFFDPGQLDHVLFFAFTTMISILLFYFTYSYYYIVLNFILLTGIFIYSAYFDISLFFGFDFILPMILMTIFLLYVEKRSIEFKEILLTNVSEVESTNSELVSMYEELEANEEELRAQYDEILENRNYLELIQRRNNLLFDASNEVIWELDLKTGKRHFSNETYVEELHLDLIQSVRFEDWAYDLHPDDKEHFVDYMNRVRSGKSQTEVFEIRVNDLNGGWKWLKSKVVSLIDSEKNVVLMAGSYSDIDSKKKDEEKIKILAYFDPLTGLLNRINLLKTIQSKLDEPSNGVCDGVLFYMDMDGFKTVNNTYGHDIGDQLICKIADRIRFARPNDIIARLGGADFVLLTTDLLICNTPASLAEYLLDILKEPYHIDGKDIYLTASMGIAIFTTEVFNAETVLRRADIALRRAKEVGKKRFVVYQSTMSEEVSDKLMMLNELRTAIEHDELSLCFQPQIDIESGRLFGFEALCRWKSATYGNVPPLKFIPIAEETGLIIPIGNWIFEESCKFIKKALDIHSGLHVSINVASQQLLNPEFNGTIKQITSMHQINEENICLEITESSLIESIDTAISYLEKLKADRYMIALDDFGTGFSSLNYLNRLPIDIIKIDKSFTKRISLHSKEYYLIKSIMQLSTDLDLSIIVEGIEEYSQVEILQSLGQPIIQGFYYGIPMKEKEALEFLLRYNG